MPDARTHTFYQRHNFGQERHRIENKLKLRSLYRGLSNGQVKVVDPFDFQQDNLRQLSETKLLNQRAVAASPDTKQGSPTRIETKDLLSSVHKQLQDRSIALQGYRANKN